MQIVSIGDNLHGMSNSVIREKYKKKKKNNNNNKKIKKNQYVAC